MSSFMAIIPTSILILLLYSFFSADQLVVADDSSAMAKLASAFHPPPPSWSTNVSSHEYCNWRYVSCDESKNVIAIDTRNYFMGGYLPTEIVNLSQMRVLSIKNNELSGTMPLLNNLTCLNTLTLSINNFSSLAPGFFQGLPTTIRELDMSYTPIAPWKMPLELTRLQNLTLLNLDQINLTGPIPDIFQSLPLLRFLSLSGNNLTGHLPPSLAKTGLENLYLDNQGKGLSGTINLLSDITTLVSVDLSYNKFTGQIPDLSQLMNLSVLFLGNNQLTGVIPPSLCSFPPQTLSVANNKLQGPLPQSLVGNPSQVVGNRFCTKTGGPCKAQVTILLEIAGALGYPLELFESWVGNDACASWKFLSCDSEKEVIGIDFGEQHFGGTISPAFANLTALRFIYLNGNNLHGSIPQNLANLTQLQVLDISNNSLSGKIPAFPQSLELNVTGNLMLEDPNLPKRRQHPPPTQTSKSKGRIKQKVVIIVVSFMGTMLGALCIFLLGKRFSGYAGKEKVEICNQGKPISKSVIVDTAAKNKNQIEFQGIKLFTFEHLASVTDNFDSANKLGQGGFGPVYKGTLENGIEVAVKRLAGASGQGSEEFMNEVMVISKLQHRNLIRLIGCCNEREENMLVYEYMPNKSLDAFLFDPHKRKILDWPKRFNIIQGICRGLLHLHTDSRLRIVHRDLKASNILLDMDLIPKISDFGIARIFNSTKDQGNTRRIMGTYGYMPPEYVLEGRFSQKSDVFSLGVLILEIVGGRRNSGLDDSDHSPSLLELAWRLWNEGNIMRLVDPTITNVCIHQEILRCMHVGLLCVQDLVTDRPAMSFVISMLSGDVTLPAPKLPIFIEWKGAKGHFEVTQK